jgi:hypothetical protein
MGTLGREGGVMVKEPLEGNMAGASKPGTVSTKQQRIAELAKQALGVPTCGSFFSDGCATGTVAQRNLDLRSRMP